MSYYVYILKSIATGRYYIGSTRDVLKRLKEHNAGKVKSTKNRGPYTVVYVEQLSSRHDAYKREMTIKKYKGGQAFKQLFSS